MLKRRMLKIVLADDQKLVREEIKFLLEDELGINVIGEARDGAEAIEITIKLKPDILVTDLRMPHFDGIEVTKRVRQLSSHTRTIILSMYGDRSYVDAALKAGARGYVLKKYSGDGLMQAISTVSDGRIYLSPSISEML
jgi:DNA-binding NarL/FixJ family response regulator